MSTQEHPEIQPNPAPGAPKAPAAEPATKAEVEAAQAAQAGTKPAEAAVPEQAQTPPVTAPEAVTQEELDAAVEEARKQAAESWSGQYVTLEHEAGNAVINMLKEKNVSPVEANRLFEKAIASGNLADVDWVGLEKALGKDQMVLAKAGISAYYNDVYTAQQRTVQEVHSVFGGEANWNTVRDWAQAREKSDPSFRKEVAEYRKALEAGGFAAKAAAEALKNAYNSAPNTKSLGTPNLVQGTHRPAAVEGPLSRNEYLELRRKAEQDGARPDVINALIARRTAGRAQGL